MYKKPTKSASAFDLYEAVTNKILEKLEQGEIPWKKPWNVKIGMPCNIISGKEYNGINVLLLGSQAYDSKYWITYKQCTDKGGTVIKGQKSSLVVFWSFLDKSANSAESDTELSSSTPGKIPMLRYYNVFNTNQCSGLDLPQLKKELEEKSLGSAPDHTDLVSAQAIVDCYTDRPDIRHGFTKACYRPSTDEINLPNPEHFTSPEEYFSTLYHELVHSTAVATRLNRINSSKPHTFGDEDYSKEELVAEMGASFLCARAGIENTVIDNSTAYIQSWMKALKNDKKLLVIAAGQAQKAANYVMKHDEHVVSVKLDETAEVATVAPTPKVTYSPTITIPATPEPPQPPQQLSKVKDDPIKQKLQEFGYTGDKLDKILDSLNECQKSDQLIAFIQSGIIATASDLEDILRVSVKSSTPAKRKSRSIN